MPHAAGDRALDQGAALHRVVEIVFERVRHQFRDDDRSREVHDRADPVLGDQAGDERAVGDVAFGERRRFGHRPVEAGEQIVDDDDRPAGIEQRQHGVAADIAGPARHQHRKLGHSISRAVRCSKSPIKSLHLLYSFIREGRGRR